MIADQTKAEDRDSQRIATIVRRAKNLRQKVGVIFWRIKVSNESCDRTSTAHTLARNNAISVSSFSMTKGFMANSLPEDRIKGNCRGRDYLP